MFSIGFKQLEALAKCKPASDNLLRSKLLYIDPRLSRQSRDAPVYISGGTAEAGGRKTII